MNRCEAYIRRLEKCHRNVCLQSHSEYDRKKKLRTTNIINKNKDPSFANVFDLIYIHTHTHAMSGETKTFTKKTRRLTASLRSARCS